MNREILFRGKTHYGKWVESKAIIDQDPNFVSLYVETAELNGGLMSEGDKIEIIPETLGQFTGLLDKDGTNIFEGDLIQTGGPLYLISFQNGAFVAASKFGYPEPLGYYETAHGIREFEKPGKHYLSDFCVSGNIHDNPDLWKH